MFLEKGRLFSTLRLTPDFYEISISTKRIHRGVKPGQFLLLRCGDDGPLLMRPFTIFDTGKGGCRILFKKRGRGTELLSRMPAAAEIEILGPLGKGFEPGLLPESTERVILCGGGSGIAPFNLLLKRLLPLLKRRGAKRPVIALLGFRMGSEALLKGELERPQVEVEVATQDGGSGFRGVVTDILSRHLEKGDEKTTLFSAGPLPMLKKVQAISKGRVLRHLLFLEGMVACGVGACLGCAVPHARGGYTLLCRDGPLFESQNIDFERL